MAKSISSGVSAIYHLYNEAYYEFSKYCRLEGRTISSVLYDLIYGYNEEMKKKYGPIKKRKR